MKNFKWLLLAIPSLFAYGCTSEGASESKKETTIPTIPVTELVPQKTEVHREYVGDIHAVRNVEIYARVKGYLEEVYVDEGKEVRKGQTLFRINNEEYEAQLASAKANLQSAIAEAKGAELELKRVKLLVEKNVISKTEVEVAEAKLAAVNAQIEEARSQKSKASIHLAQTEIKAPFDGIIDRIPHKMGSLIDEGTLLTTLSDTKSVFAYFNVSENEYLEYVKARGQGQSATVVELELADGSYFKQKGTVETMEGAFDEGTGSIAFRARFQNPEKLLKHGSTGTIRLTNTVENAILVPQKAAFEIQDKNFVYVLGKDNKIKTRSFVPKSRLAGYYVVKSGLKSGETIVYEGLQGLKDGATITPKNIPLDSLNVKATKIELTAR
ncbi:efflux RND transporter periplasmic adaptor subunit [Dyadobacter chenhuakuii]|uniref:Efflux RND transporter periplasmic adaptor subunit n=1 Tax=Dyadobacter chenhuakuii TaxID=2909339 RepID=A0A9X1QBK2_9BACT|nr:efflux RND transporter periplasmic adaptor subunit [Dyadobacter chenhuakuii]MCF2491853.1 efflux RND transporter periplasmic adaptor subunit [Dyadobacter chenhuakuii]MCF2498793.1 efflux RND transporter periplasmic adaptor subunit [Dyadobacter chenhuakuii]USJ28983.1 efflux RND transporter periplasmic adaptor subunit [Dyadobacter chenhuakuii]